MSKTSIQIKHSGSIWPVVDDWAFENGFKLETPGDSRRLYVRKGEDSNSKINLAISQVGADVRIDVWFSDAVRSELALDSLSLYSALPRKEALSEVQKLLAELGYIPPGKRKTRDKQNFAFNLGRSIRKLSGKK